MVDPRSNAGRRRLRGNWTSDGVVVDGYRDEGLPWPVETRRLAYVTPFGGQSSDLAPGSVGLHRQALEENTDLGEGDRVTIAVFEHNSKLPYVFRQEFEVVALDFARPDGFLRSVDGEAVLALAEPEVERRRLGEVREGVNLVLNGVLGRLGGRWAPV